MKREIYSGENPIFSMTETQLRQIIKEVVNESLGVDEKKPAKRYAYGIKGIRNIFNVSHATACRYKENIIKDAVSQVGRVIVTDVDKAIELFNKHSKK